MPASRPIGPAHKWQQRQQHEEIGNTRWGAREAASRIKNAITILKNGPARDGDRASLATGSKLRISPWIPIPRSDSILVVLDIRTTFDIPIAPFSF